QNPQVELLVPEGPVPGGTPVASPGAIKLEAATPALSGGQLPVLEDDEESYTGVSSVRRLPTQRRRHVSWMAAAAGVVLTVPGAEVTAEDGIRLGVTPTTLSIRRSEKALVLVVAKTGYLSTRQSIVPDRDISALLTLRTDEDMIKKRAPAARSRRRAAAATDG